jgi:ribosome recycling factor
LIKTLVSSNANNALNASPLNLNVNNASSLVNVNVSSGTLDKNKYMVPVLTNKVEYNTLLSVGSNNEDSGVLRQ